ncbi:MAG: pseudouridine synthase [Nitrospirota bacterium]
MEQRIQKILAQMGVASRRKAEELIEEGRVTVNGAPATLGMKADAARDHIKVDGKLITKPEPKVYYAFNKPRGVVTSLSDPEGRPTVKDFLGKVRFRVFPVGRLDYDSEGLLLITNDGDFAQSVLHPSKKMPKTYYVKVKGIIDDETMERLRRGVRLEDGVTAPAKVRKVRETESNSWLEMVIHEGKKRQIRRMLEKVGYPVIKLRRTAINGLALKGLGIGELRPLTPEEVQLISRESSA